MSYKHKRERIVAEYEAWRQQNQQQPNTKPVYRQEQNLMDQPGGLLPEVHKDEPPATTMMASGQEDYRASDEVCMEHGGVWKIICPKCNLHITKI